MIESLFAFAEASQVIVITPFILMGAMGPVSIPAALAQQTAEALTGIALTQLVRPGAPAIMGSFVSHSDMQSGSPGFGGPESALGLLASGQIARRYGLLWRAGGGGLTSATVADAQAAAESLNTLMPAFLAGANLMLHSAGWLESGLVACYEKYMLDIELLRILREQMRPLEIDEASLAFDAHDEVRHGGHFFGAAAHAGALPHVLLPPDRVLDRQLRPLEADGRLDAAARATGAGRSCWRPTSGRRSTTRSRPSSRSTSRGAARRSRPSSESARAPSLRERFRPTVGIPPESGSG